MTLRDAALMASATRPCTTRRSASMAKQQVRPPSWRASAGNERATGADVILVLPLLESGWLEQSSMGMLRRQTLAKLRRSDRHGRLHIYYPKLPASEHGLQIHGKVMICDDRMLKIGSANLSNR